MQRFNDEQYDVLAKSWVDKVTSDWSDAITNSVSNSIVERNFKLQSMPEKRFEYTNVHLIQCGSERAIQLFAGDGKLCVLNYASYKGPGGGFIKGKMAQEETLCHWSSLYPVLNEFRSEYMSRLNRLNNGYYHEDFIYSPDVLFSREQYSTDNPIKADVLTYAAPCMLRRPKTDEYYDIWRTRLVNALVYPAFHGADKYIIGAWGCGVFCNSPRFVAEVWDAIMPYVDGLYSDIIYAIPDGKNFYVFKDVLKNNLCQ